MAKEPQPAKRSQSVDANPIQSTLIVKELNESKNEILIEQLKHDILILEEWKKEVGLIAIDTVNILTNKLQTLQQTNETYKIEIESLQTQIQALNTQIDAYCDEIFNLKRVQPTIESQLNEFEEMLTNQHIITKSLTFDNNQMSSLQSDYDDIKQSLLNNKLEIRELNRQNNSLKKENSSYLLLVDKLRENENKLKHNINELQLNINLLNKNNSEMKNKLNYQLISHQNTQYIVNDLSVKLHEYQNKQHHIDLGIAVDPDPLPALAKRKTLKIMNMYDNNSLKLPVYMDTDTAAVGNTANSSCDDEYMEMEMDMKSIHNGSNGKQSNPLSPVDEFSDDTVNHDHDHDDDGMSPLLLQTLNSHNKSFQYGRVYADDDEKIKSLDKDIAALHSLHSVASSSASSSTCSSSDDEIDRLLRRVSGSSYNKYINGNNGTKHFRMDSLLKKKLKFAILKFKNKLKIDFDNKLLKEKNILINRYKNENQIYQDKYKKLKKEIKLRQFNKKQKKQTKHSKSNDLNNNKAGSIGGCKFWTWNALKQCTPKSTNGVNKKHGHKVINAVSMDGDLKAIKIKTITNDDDS